MHDACATCVLSVTACECPLLTPEPIPLQGKRGGSGGRWQVVAGVSFVGY